MGVQSTGDTTMVTIQTPRNVQTTGASLTGTDATTNRTYTLPFDNVVSGLTEIHINGAFLHEGTGKDFTISSNLITFLNAVFNDQIITINYYTQQSGTVTTSSDYVSTLQLARFMGIESTVPDYNTTGSSRLKETIGTGDNTETIFWLDNARVLAGSYAIYYGTTEAGSTALTETTHYSVNKDLGKVTLTSAGVTLVATKNIYGAYSYVSADAGVTDTQLQSAIDRAKQEIHTKTYQKWYDGTAATPGYDSVSNEEQDGQGNWNREYYLKNYPIPNVSTTLSSPLTVGALTANVASTAGFPESGTFGISANKIEYTSKATALFLGLTGVSATCVTSSVIHPYVIETSTSDQGTTPSYDVLQKDKDYDINIRTGRVHLYEKEPTPSNAIIFNAYPERMVPNRFRGSYIWGNSSIPDDIKRLNLMMASKDVLHKIVRKGHVTGLNGFVPAMINVDDEDIKAIIDNYTHYKNVNI